MFPLQTLQEAVSFIRRGLGCQAEVVDGDMAEFHGKAARVHTGLMYREGRQIGTFMVVQIRQPSGEKQTVLIAIGSVGEFVANPITEAAFDKWVEALEPWV